MPNSPSTPPADSPETHEQPAVPRKRLSRRASLIGTTIAIVVAGGLAWLAWDLTRPEQTASMQRGQGGGGGGGGARMGGGGGGGGRGGATTVGFAVAEAADIPVVIDALGTVVPQATVRVRPQVSGVL